MTAAQQWDVKVVDHGNLILFHTSSEAVQDWFADYTDAQTFGPAYVVEHRYAGDIVEALQAEGFTVL